MTSVICPKTCIYIPTLSCMASVIYVIFTEQVCGVCVQQFLYVSTCTSVLYVHMYVLSHLPSQSPARLYLGYSSVQPHSCADNQTSWLWFFSFCSCSPCTARGLHTEVVNLRPPRHLHQRQLQVLVEARGTVGRKPRMRLRLNSSATWSPTLQHKMSPLNRPC